MINLKTILVIENNIWKGCNAVLWYSGSWNKANRILQRWYAFVSVWTKFFIPIFPFADTQNEGLSGLLRRRLSDIGEILTNSLKKYRAILGPDGSVLSEYEDDPDDIEDPYPIDDSETSDEEEDECW